MNIPVYSPDLSGNERKYVDDCLDTGWVSSKGPYIDKFEKAFSEFLGVNYASTVSNGTVALHVALLALGIGPGDEVIVPTFTYIASVNAISYVGAKPVFIDSSRDDWQMDARRLDDLVSSSTKAIMVVHLYGQPCNMEEVAKVAKKHNLFIIEDCAEAIGSKVGSKYVGTIGDIATFSFFGNKTITTGEGGMVVTDDVEIDRKIRHLKGQGLVTKKEYWHDIIGYNYRMTNICAAIGLAQIERIDTLLAKKKQLAENYTRLLLPLSDKVSIHKQSTGTTHTYWMYSILVEKELRDPLRKHLSSNGIDTRPLFFPIHSMPMYYDKNNVFPVADELSSRGLNLPSYPSLTHKQQEIIARTIRGFFGE